MSVSRRAFVRNLAGRPARALAIAARGREAWTAEHWPDDQAVPPRSVRANAIRLNSNENPLGPSRAALAAIERAFAYAGRYPMNARPAAGDFRALVARRNGVKPENVALGAGSGEILDAATRAFTSPSRGLVAALPTFETPARVARQIGSAIREIPVADDGTLDLEQVIAASKGAGLVFVCNPNNPTGLVHSSDQITDLVKAVKRASPDTVILLDEAYHDYVTSPAYATAMPLAASNPNVLVSRTMSKVYGMAGLRLGYAVGHADVIERLANWTMPYNANALVVAAAIEALQDEAEVATEVRRNTEVRAFAAAFFRDAGFSVTDSQTNFLWVKLGRPAKPFREACAKDGILVGRDFPPFEKTHCRISIGTMDEMRRAIDVFKTVLAGSSTAAR